jgi:hypothetical protein
MPAVTLPSRPAPSPSHRPHHSRGPRPRRSDAPPAHRIGDITLTPDTVATPSGQSSTAQVDWHIDDASTPIQWSGTTEGAGGVVGAVRVTATAPGWKHVTAVRVATLDEVTAIYAKVLRMRRLARL